MLHQRHITRSRVLIAGLACLACTGLSLAGKPGGGTVPAGRIYFFDAEIGVMSSMKADGTNKTAAIFSEPCHQLHNDDAGQPRRWFLDVRLVPELGNSPPQGYEGLVWPRREVFAVRDDGFAVRLTDDPLVLPRGDMRWSHTDSFISFIAVAWDVDGVESGVVCRAPLAFDAQGVPMLTAAPTVWMDSDVWYDGGSTYPDLQGHDWSPAGDQLVFSDLIGGSIWPAGGIYPRLFVTTFGTDVITVPLAYGNYAQWSSQGRIAFTGFNTATAFYSGLWTVLGDGSGLVQLSSSYDRYASWSPDGTHLAVARMTWNNKGGQRTYYHDIMRIPSSGGTAVNLTNDIAGILIVAGWR